MQVFHKARRFILSPMARKRMLIEAYFYLAWGRVFKLIPFHISSSYLGERMLETPYIGYNKDDLRQLQSISRAIHTMSHLTWWESECMVKAVAAMKMLERRGIPSTIYLGAGRDDMGNMAAHAWIRSGTYILTGKEGHERYAVVGVFGKLVKAKLSS